MFTKPTDASAMLDSSYLSELRPSGCGDDDAGTAKSDGGPKRSGFRELVRKVKRRVKWWLRDRDLEKWDDFVEGVIRTRKQKDDPVRRSPMMLRFARSTRFKPRTASIYDPAERERDMGTLRKRRRQEK